MSNYKDLTIQDFEILAKLPMMTSIRSFAQNLGMSPSFLSKKIKKLEDVLGATLINRTSKGITTTIEADSLILMARAIMEKFDESYLIQPTVSQKKSQRITIGTRGFLNTSFASTIITHFEQKNIDVNFRLIDMSPIDQINSAKSNEVDILIGLKETNFGELWQTEKIGDLIWSIYARKGHPLAKFESVTIEQALIYPFTRPCYWDGTSIMTITDSIPLDGNKISYGHGIQNTQTAISVICCTNNLTYIPRVSAKRSLELGEIVEIQINEIKPKKDSVYLSVHTQTVTNKILKEFKDALKTLTN